MCERKDLEKINAGDSNCTHKQFETNRLKHLQSHLLKAGEQLALKTQSAKKQIRMCCQTR